jgi:hypothetical protein
VKKIPPEIDDLMWVVAERNSDSAAAEFIDRYPIYREELLRRRETVKRLKTGGRKVTRSAREIPRFTPKSQPQFQTDRRFVLIAACFVLAAIAVASYTLTTFLSPNPVKKPSRVRAFTTAKVPSLPKSEIVMTNPTPTLTPSPTLVPTHTEPVKSTESPTPKPRSISIKKAGLKSVIKLIAADSGLKIIFAPGMPNPPVTVSYHGLTAMEMLQDLGNQYLFTAFDQGDGSVVIYPAVDSTGGRDGNSGNSPVRRIGG